MTNTPRRMSADEVNQFYDAHYKEMNNKMTNQDLHPLAETLLTAPYTQYQGRSDLHARTVNQIILDYLEGVYTQLTDPEADFDIHIGEETRRILSLPREKSSEKEVVKEILASLRKVPQDIYYPEDYGAWVSDRLVELCKQYGVE